MSELDAGHHVEEFAGDMIDAAYSGRRHVDLAWIGFGIGNELRNSVGRHRWIHHHHGGDAKNASDGLDVTNKVEIERVVKRRIDCICLSDPEQCVAIARCVHDRVGGDIDARTGAIFDDELLTEVFRQPLRHKPRGDVRRGPGRKADNDMNRTRRIIERKRAAGACAPIDYRQCAGADNKTQECFAAELHDEQGYTNPPVTCRDAAPSVSLILASAKGGL